MVHLCTSDDRPQSKVPTNVPSSQRLVQRSHAVACLINSGAGATSTSALLYRSYNDQGGICNGLDWSSCECAGNVWTDLSKRAIFTCSESMKNENLFIQWAV